MGWEALPIISVQRIYDFISDGYPVDGTHDRFHRGSCRLNQHDAVGALPTHIHRVKPLILCRR